MNKIFYTLLLSLPLCAMEDRIVRINDTHVQYPSAVSDISVYHDDNGFSVVTEGQIHQIPNHNLNAPLRKINREMLARVLEQGYLRVKKYDNGEFGLDANGRINGGGPVLAAIGYGIVKAAGWAFVSAAASKTINDLSRGDNAAKSTAGTVVKGAGAMQGADGNAVYQSPKQAVGTGAVGTYMGTKAADKMGTHDSALACVAVGAGVGAVIENAALAVYGFLLSLPTP